MKKGTVDASTLMGAGMWPSALKLVAVRRALAIHLLLVM
jgi:hypothetical protein